MVRIVDSRCVLAVRDLEDSTRYYVDVLGFTLDPIEADGWSFLSRDSFKVMLGECPDERPASELGTIRTLRTCELHSRGGGHDEEA